MVPFIELKIKCALEGSAHGWRVSSALGRRRELWGAAEEALLRLAARGPRAVPVHAHREGGEELGWAEEQGLQQSPAALSSRGGAARARGWAAELVQDTIFPAKEGARKERDRGRESQGAALGKFSLKSVCFCFHIHKYCELFVSTTQ